MPDTVIPSFYRKLWFVNLMTCLLLTFPVALLILITGQVYKLRGGIRQPIKPITRAIYGGLLGIWFIALGIKSLTDPDYIRHQWAESADHSDKSLSGPADKPSSGSQQNASASDDDALEACDSSTATDAVKDAIENGADSKLVSVQVLDFGKVQETWFEKDRNVRRCAADASLNTGETVVTYQIYLGPSGKQLVQVQTGDEATFQHEQDQIDRKNAEEMAARAKEDVQQQAPADSLPQAPQPNDQSQDQSQQAPTSSPPATQGQDAN